MAKREEATSWQYFASANNPIPAQFSNRNTTKSLKLLKKVGVVLPVVQWIGQKMLIAGLTLHTMQTIQGFIGFGFSLFSL